MRNPPKLFSQYTPMQQELRENTRKAQRNLTKRQIAYHCAEVENHPRHQRQVLKVQLMQALALWREAMQAEYAAY